MKTIKILDREYSVNVEGIDLSYTRIKDISVLKECKKLKELYLDHTEVKEDDPTVKFLGERGVCFMFYNL